MNANSFFRWQLIVLGNASEGDNPRGQIWNTNFDLFGTNFQAAVTLAIRETRRQWADFQSELIRLHGSRKGYLMICAMTRDNPKDCCSDHMDTDPLNCGKCGNTVS